MTTLKETVDFKVRTEAEALKAIEEERVKAAQEGYQIMKATYAYKSKKAKGEIIDEGYQVTIARTFHDFWEDEV